MSESAAKRRRTEKGDGKDNDNILPHEFFNRDTLTVARELLGKVLVRLVGDIRLSGRIVETEAYIGEEDAACHGRFGPNGRSAPMFGEAGHAYCYFIYGNHVLFNIVTEAVGRPCAVLIRALEPVENIDLMRASRPKAKRVKEIANGPAKLTQALQIDLSHNCIDVCGGDGANTIFVENLEGDADGEAFEVKTGPRIGIESVAREWREKPWRFWIECEYVSK